MPDMRSSFSTWSNEATIAGAVATGQERVGKGGPPLTEIKTPDGPIALTQLQLGRLKNMVNMGLGSYATLTKHFHEYGHFDLSTPAHVMAPVIQTGATDPVAAARTAHFRAGGSITTFDPPEQRSGLRLTSEAQAERDRFDADDGCCSCHSNPPCGWCTDPGNPRNQAEDETAWEPVPVAELLRPAEERTGYDHEGTLRLIIHVMASLKDRPALKDAVDELYRRFSTVATFEATLQRSKKADAATQKALVDLRTAQSGLSFARQETSKANEERYQAESDLKRLLVEKIETMREIAQLETRLAALKADPELPSDIAIGGRAMQL